MLTDRTTGDAVASLDRRLNSVSLRQMEIVRSRGLPFGRNEPLQASWFGRIQPRFRRRNEFADRKGRCWVSSVFPDAANPRGAWQAPARARFRNLLQELRARDPQHAAAGVPPSPPAGRRARPMRANPSTGMA